MDANSLSNLGTECVVRIKRRHGDKLTGVVAAVGTKWALLHTVWDLELAGLTAVRLSDITKLSLDHRGDEVVARSLHLRGVFPLPVQGFALNTTAELLVDLKRRRQFVTVHPDRRWPDTCHLGYITNVDATRKTFSLLELTPAAVWEDTATTWRFRDVRRIDLNDGYAIALASLAGSPPGITLS